MNTIKQYFLPKDGYLHIDFFSGLTVALALIPEAIAFALVAHVSPQVGLFAAFIMCLTSALFGGRPGMISGATGSMAVVMVSIVSQYNLSLLFATVILTGVIQIIAGLLRLGKCIRMLPKSVMVGFVNGLAIVIFLAQLHQFSTLPTPSQPAHWLHGKSLYTMIGLVLIAMAITHFLPKVTKKIPAALTAIVVVTSVVVIGNIHTHLVKDMMSGNQISAHFPPFSFPHVTFNWSTLSIILPYAMILAIIGLSESLMTLSLIDERTNTHGKGNQECLAQGVGNIISGCFQSMGGCAMIGQSMINITSGGRGRLSGIVAGVFLLIFILLLWNYIEMIPLAALVGVMFMVVIETFEWATFKFIRKIPPHDALIIIVVTGTTVATNLATAVVVGVILAALVFAWQTAKNIHAEERILKDHSKLYTVHGPLFFGSSTTFKTLFAAQKDPKKVIIDFKFSRVMDHSAIDAIVYVTELYSRQHKELHLKHLSSECRLLLGRAGSMVDINVIEDPDYHVATDVLD